MKKKQDKIVNQIKYMMMESLEGPYTKSSDGKGQILNGEFLCHEDIPEETPLGFDAHFCVVGESDKYSYLVLIQKIKF